MSKAERLFRAYLVRAFPGAYIKKLPDYKQTGSGALRGLPDFIVVSQGRTLWFEVKYTTSRRSFTLNEIRAAQWIEFAALLEHGGYDVQIAIYDGAYELHWRTFSHLLTARSLNNRRISL
jgi:Holliday junction resolvase